jgi:diphthamide synthase (EF-2-diphthine--ammonia ligase)
LPLHVIEIPYPCSNKEYEEIMQKFIAKIKTDEIEAVAFGDLYLEGIRDYRIKQMENTGIECIFPCWGIETKILAKQIIKIGIKAKIVCLDPKKLAIKFAGKDYDEDFIASLPNEIDPCGENGEFHSFVQDAPFFQNPIKIKQKETIERDGFIFTDITFQ